MEPRTVRVIGLSQTEESLWVASEMVHFHGYFNATFSDGSSYVGYYNNGMREGLGTHTKNRWLNVCWGISEVTSEMVKALALTQMVPNLLGSTRAVLDGPALNSMKMAKLPQII